jgi:cytochrome P450
MSRFCPVYPKPLKSKASMLLMFFGKRRSWLDGLYERSYGMKMGEIKLPGLALYMVNEPPLVRRVLVEQAAKFPKHTLLGKLLKPLLGESIFTTNGEQWQRQRAMMDQSFAQTRLKLVFPLMKAAASAMQERLDRLPDGAAYDVDVEMTHVTADIIFRTILSQTLSGASAHKIFDAFTRFQELAPRIVNPVLFKLPRLFAPWLAIRRSNAAAGEIRAHLEGFIRPRYEAHNQGNPGAHQDILASLLDAVDPQTGRGFSFDELVDQVAMLFLAGHETSASALAWSLYLIAMSPEIQERMHDEAVAVLGGKDPDYSDIKQMSLIWNVFRETLRLYPPVGFFARQATETQPMRDKTIHAGASVVIAPWLIHRHRDLWERPDEFDPDRYNTDSARESLKCAYLPFGLGPRVCMGATFALQEAGLILATLVKRYRFEPLPDHQPQPVGRLTIRSDNGIRVRILKREGAVEKTP